MGMLVATVVKWFSGPLGKYLLIGLTVAALVGGGIFWWNRHEAALIEEGRQIGRKEITMEYQALVKENDRVNRKVEARVDSALSKFTSRLEETLGRVRIESAKISGNIDAQINSKPQVFKNPTCDTPKETIDSRNAIRLLGPTPSETPTE